MIPKINFIYSDIYQEVYHLPKNYKYNFKIDEKFVESYINFISKEWKKYGSKILKYIQKITNLKFKRKEIDCFVIKISKYVPISHPLTIPIQGTDGQNILTLTKEQFFDMLVHELIHNLFIDNEKKTKKYFNYIIKKKYRRYSWNTSIHVPLHAIHKEIFLKFFDENRLKKEIYFASFFPEYKRAWEIVLEEGSKNIIKEFRKRVK